MTIREIDGVDVHVEGSGSPAIVMLHGWPDTYRLWDAQVAAFSPRFTCVRFTLPGFDVDKPRRALSLEQMIGFVKSVVEQTCPAQKVILMLHDWGAFFGYQFAMRHPGLVSRIVGVDIGNSSSAAFKRSLSVKTKLMLLTYQVWLAFAWRIGGGLGDRMTVHEPHTAVTRAAAFRRLVHELPVLHQVDGRLPLVQGCGRSRAGVADAVHLRAQEAVHVPQRRMGRFDCRQARQSGACIGDRPLGQVQDAARFNRAVLAWLDTSSGAASSPM